MDSDEALDRLIISLMDVSTTVDNHHHVVKECAPFLNAYDRIQFEGLGRKPWHELERLKEAATKTQEHRLRQRDGAYVASVIGESDG